MAEGVFRIARTHSMGDRFTQSAVCTSSPLRVLLPCWTNCFEHPVSPLNSETGWIPVGLSSRLVPHLMDQE